MVTHGEPNYPPFVNSPEGEDWKKRLKALGIVRKRKTRDKKEKDLRKVKRGALGEGIACSLLEVNLLRILHRNVRYPDGEIDIIALDGPVVVFVEVKWRRNDALGSAAEAVTPKKRERVVRAARRWLVENPGRAAAVRFDVVAIRDEPREVLWIRGAFDAGR